MRRKTIQNKIKKVIFIWDVILECDDSQGNKKIFMFWRISVRTVYLVCIRIQLFSWRRNQSFLSKNNNQMLLINAVMVNYWNCIL